MRKRARTPTPGIASDARLVDPRRLRCQTERCASLSRPRSRWRSSWARLRQRVEDAQGGRAPQRARARRLSFRASRPRRLPVGKFLRERQGADRLRLALCVLCVCGAPAQVGVLRRCVALSSLACALIVLPGALARFRCALASARAPKLRASVAALAAAALIATDDDADGDARRRRHARTALVAGASPCDAAAARPPVEKAPCSLLRPPFSGAAVGCNPQFRTPSAPSVVSFNLVASRGAQGARCSVHRQESTSEKAGPVCP